MTVPGRTPSFPQASRKGQQTRQLSYGYDPLHSRGYVHHSRCHNCFHTSSAYQHQHQHQHRLSSLGESDAVSSLLPHASSSPSQNQSFSPPEISAVIADPVVSATPASDVATIQDDPSFSDSIPVEDAANSSSVPLQTTVVGLIEEIISVALTLSSPPALTPLLDGVGGVIQPSCTSHLVNLWRFRLVSCTSPSGPCKSLILCNSRLRC